ncbi:DUF6538 domain-containing protein [Bradyrhizobium genosp. P]|uniref:DUF6538 domain-containing protein n=1 Tax=Bradyrhizobium genosp. P TaxID=83641 RepID=UPI003CF234B5
MPERYRDVVGRGEVRRSLDTTEFKTAIVRCHKLSLELEGLRRSPAGGSSRPQNDDRVGPDDGRPGPQRATAARPRAGARGPDPQARIHLDTSRY